MRTLSSSYCICSIAINLGVLLYSCFLDPSLVAIILRVNAPDGNAHLGITIKKVAISIKPVKVHTVTCHMVYLLDFLF